MNRMTLETARKIANLANWPQHVDCSPVLEEVFGGAWGVVNGMYRKL